MSRSNKLNSAAQVVSLKHKDKRANIPTEELRDFVKDEEKAPKKMLYPRDLSLDPQLVWKGKDDQDQKDLEVPLVPLLSPPSDDNFAEDSSFNWLGFWGEGHTIQH